MREGLGLHQRWGMRSSLLRVGITHKGTLPGTDLHDRGRLPKWKLLPRRMLCKPLWHCRSYLQCGLVRRVRDLCDCLSRQHPVQQRRLLRGAEASVRSGGRHSTMRRARTHGWFLVLALTACCDANAHSTSSSTEIIRASMEAVVRIHTSGDMAQASGSGFFFRARTGEIYIVTNHHVVWGASTITIERNDGVVEPATVFASDPATDLALIRPASRQAPHALSFGDDRALRPGDWVCALGSPNGVFNAASVGILSARGRLQGAAVAGERLVDHLFVDAVTSSGSSGGPILDRHGKVVGVSAATLGTSRGLGVAVPSSLASAVIAQLVANGHATHASLGMQVADAPAAIDPQHGLRVTDVGARGAADIAQIRVGDYLLKIDGQPVPDPVELRMRAFESAAGMSWRLELLRNGERITRTIQLHDVSEATTIR